MDAEIRRIILAALDNYRGDDLERASAAFRGCTPEQMQQQYGASGRTQQEILDGYRTHVTSVKKATAWLKGLSGRG